MTLIERLKQDIITAMKEKDKLKLETLRAVKGAIQLEVINNKKEENDDLLITCINKQIKMRKDSITEFEKANRNDLIEKYQNEIEILNKYMPKMLTEEEIDKVIDETIEKLNAKSEKDFGTVMKEISISLKNKCDMRQVTQKIKEKLSE